MINRKAGLMSLGLARLVESKRAPFFPVAVAEGSRAAGLREGLSCSSVALRALALAGCLVAMAPFSGAQAQVVDGGSASQLQGLANRLDRVQRDISTLQQFVYRGEVPPSAGVGGAAGQEAQVAVRAYLDQVEEGMRRLTGQIERIGHDLQRFSGKIDRLAADVDLRLQQLERTQAATTAVALEKQALASGDLIADSPRQEGSVQILGDVPQSALDGPSLDGSVPNGNEQQSTVTGVEVRDLGAQTDSDGVATSAVVVLPEVSSAEQYRFAFDLLKSGRYAEAESAFKQFLSANPTDVSAGNAQYWLGETYYVRGDYRQAAVAFADGYQKYPDGRKAADNLLKLGMSLSSMGQTADACGTFSALLLKYPQANPTLLQRATKQKEFLSCP